MFSSFFLFLFFVETKLNFCVSLFCQKIIFSLRLAKTKQKGKKKYPSKIDRLLLPPVFEINKYWILWRGRNIVESAWRVQIRASFVTFHFAKKYCQEMYETISSYHNPIKLQQKYYHEIHESISLSASTPTTTKIVGKCKNPFLLMPHPNTNTVRKRIWIHLLLPPPQHKYS